MTDTSKNTPTKTFTFPSFIKAAIQGNRPVEATLSSLVDSNAESTSSFRYDSRGDPLKSSQQLNVDWSQFENHCFFMSAEALVNIAFDQIVNGFPFDGSKQESESFFDCLTGFEKWVFDQFPKYKGALLFSGTQVGEDIDGTLGTWIEIKDKQGALFPELAREASGLSVMNPLNKSFSLEAHVLIPSQSNDTQVICQKFNADSNDGFTLYVSASAASEPKTNVRFVITSGTNNIISVEGEVNKGVYNHIVATLDRSRPESTALLYNNFKQIGVSPGRFTIGSMAIDDSPLYIGSGSGWSEKGIAVTPTQTFSGSIDEFRFWHSLRTVKEQELYHQKSVTSTDDLVAYFRFNEPPPPLVSDENSGVNAIVLDSSGNSLHSLVVNFTGSLRKSVDDDPDTLMIYERDELSPVLFPAYESLIDLNIQLLESASLYDEANPNLITKLIPEAWLLGGSFYEGYNNQDGNAAEPYSGQGIPGQGELGQTHLILSFIYIYARFFDEIKVMIDQFSNLHHVSYEQFETTPNTFLYDLIRRWGIDMPPLFNESSIEQYVHAENIDDQVSVGDIPLRTVQDELMKRVLIHLPKIVRSKGTVYAIQTFLRSIGIDPENSVRIREFGGPTENNLEIARESKVEPSLMLKMNTGSLVVSPFLTGSRVEPGVPFISGMFVSASHFPPHGISNVPNDGLLTSGSWTYEAIYKWPPKRLLATEGGFETTQSLARIIVTGSNESEGGIVANLTAVSSSGGSRLNLHVRPGSAPESPYWQVSLPLGTTDAGIFNGDRWNVAFGHTNPSENDSLHTGSYFIKASSQNYGEITRIYLTSSNFHEFAYPTASSEYHALRSYANNVFSGSTYYSASLNASGAFLQVGQGTQVISGATYHETGSLYLNNTLWAPDEARAVAFVGLISNVRFWSKALTDDEFREHTRNYKSTGVEDPKVNYNFNKTSSGSFERLRLNSIWQQEERQPIATASNGFPTGTLFMWDHSQNNMHLTGTGFRLYENALIGELFDHSYFSPYFDEGVSNEKIRIRGANSLELVHRYPWTSFGPAYETPPAERPTDDVRFAIEFSLVDSLNQDIITIFSTLDELGNAIGGPELAFAPDYPELENLRDIYFNRIEEKIDFKAFFEFYRWFDTAIGTFIEQLIPRKTNFRGTNFVIESHMLERPKATYQFEEMYVQENDRSRFRDVLLVQQIVGTLRKF